MAVRAQKVFPKEACRKHRIAPESDVPATTIVRAAVTAAVLTDIACSFKISEESSLIHFSPKIRASTSATIVTDGATKPLDPAANSSGS